MSLVRRKLQMKVKVGEEEVLLVRRQIQMNIESGGGGGVPPIMLNSSASSTLLSSTIKGMKRNIITSVTPEKSKSE